ncbi:hypothetical protein [Ideonella alba]|uniref:HAF repeat-containing protein n=1 Tax=Ideonella alba TaxID=2824118 RepID=A0A940Y5H6_9BURK|nr:hypothetical protein [Ideonella alba]MBQ0930564.1 hypothetical protein [Ideonella alba]
MKRCLGVLAVVLAWVAASGHAAAAPRYELVDLGVLRQGDQSEAKAINNADEIVGVAYQSGGAGYPVRFVHGRAQRLIQHSAPPYRSGQVTAISDAGHITGQLHIGRSTNPVFVTLGDITTQYEPPEGSASAHGINSQGQVVGRRSQPMQPDRAFLMHDGQWQDLPVPQPELPSIAWAINDAGQVAGIVRQTVDGVQGQYGALWQDGVLKETFGLPGSLSTLALAINRQGWVVGSSQVGPHYFQTHAYLHRDGVTIDLETRHGARSYAYGINAAGDVIGDRALAGRSGPFLYSGGRLWWLAKLLPTAQQAQWRLLWVRGINDAGHVVGLARNAEGSLRAVMLRRLDPNPAGR